MHIATTSAVVTGGASGLGEATVRLLASHGAIPVIADVADERGKALAAELGVPFCYTDVTDTDHVIAAVETAQEAGPLRSLVNCAGILSAQRTIGKDGQYSSAFNLDLFRRVIDINLLGTFNCIRIAATAMSLNQPVDPSGQRGAIVNASSLAAFDGQIGQAAYAASKGGVVGMTLPIARDLAVVGIRVNTIAPGLIDTPIYGSGPSAEAFKSNLSKDVVFPKRLGLAAEFASLALELLTNDYMNAETVRIDGGVRLGPK